MENGQDVQSDADFLKCAKCGKHLAAPDETCNCAEANEENIAPSNAIPTHLLLAIFSTVCCCLPFGLVAVIYAAKVDMALKYGDMKKARDCSEKAEFWAITAVAAIVLFYAAILIVNICTGTELRR